MPSPRGQKTPPIGEEPWKEAIGVKEVLNGAQGSYGEKDGKKA